MNWYRKYILPKFLDLAMRSKDMEELRPEAIKRASGITLEIGFGSGLNLPYYNGITKLYALEPSMELIEIAKTRVKQTSFPIEYLRASAENIPLGDKTIDTVLSTWTFCTIPRPEIALGEIKRVLKPGGTFIFIEHGRSPRHAVEVFQNVLTPLSKRFAGGCHLNRDISTLLTESGFKFMSLETFSQKNKPLAFMYKGIAVPKDNV
jgi:ubiquinone/menaquinone biosynthesis C-methylase UbiE